MIQVPFLLSYIPFFIHTHFPKVLLNYLFSSQVKHVFYAAFHIVLQATHLFSFVKYGVSIGQTQCRVYSYRMKPYGQATHDLCRELHKLGFLHATHVLLWLR